MIGIRGAVTTSALALAVLTSTAATATAAGSVLVDGGGYGPTRQTALDAALEDAHATAQSIGYYGPCTTIGEPQVFFDPADPYGRYYRAQLQANCEE
ncbi:hypothetical protein [Actinomadura macra]|uniref:hypothetical protein n=1 Tax=Actinomadura macra TaxID=46164 RepID=UPI00082E24AF|nr:hypothetical protein [Actinomadura macra]